MARAMWSGVIGFGMVSIPVKLYAATENHNVSFHQIHSECKTRIKELRWCPSCEREVEWKDIEKGFEYSKGEYIEVTDKDFEKLPLPSKNVIEVTAFVQSGEIDPIYFEKSYYLEPDKQGKRPFNLFLESLSKKDMIAIGSITLRTKERLCALRPIGSTVGLATLVYPDELRIDPTEELPTQKATKQELDMASNLIDLLAEEFDPSKYRDRYREALMKVLDAKLDGEPVKVSRKKATGGEVVDLLEALKQSISGAKSSAKSGTKASRKRDAEEPLAKSPRSGKTKTPHAKPRRKSAAKTSGRKRSAS